MEAKDTVMTRDEIGLTISEIGKEGTTAQRTYAFCGAVAQVQAEITWDIAFKAGREAERTFILQNTDSRNGG